MTTIDRRGPKIPLITRPQSSIRQFVRFVDADNANSILDLSSYNMYLTVRQNGNDVSFLTRVNQFWASEIKASRIARDTQGNPFQPLDSGIYLNLNTGAGNQPNGGDYILILNQFPNALFPIGNYQIDWVIQYLFGSTDVLLTIDWTVTNDIPEGITTEDAPFVKVPISSLSPAPIQIGIKTIQTPQ